MKNIFKWFTLDDSEVKVLWFTNQYPVDEFSGIEKVLMLFLNYCADLGISAKLKYLEAFLKTEGKKVIKQNNIKLPTMDNFNYNEPTALEEATRVITSAVVETYAAYTSDDIELTSFKVDVSSFLMRMQSQRVIELMTEAFPKVNNGEDVSELIETMGYKLSRVSGIYDSSALKKLDFMEGRTNSSSSKGIMELLFKTDLPCIDGDIGGFFSKQLWALTGSPGSGKTRLSLSNFVYPAIISAKIDVLFDELEMSETEIRNILVAHHITYLYRGRIKIPDTLINKGQLTEEQMKYVEAARIDLFESGKYGRVFIRTDDLIVEKIDRDTRSFFKAHKNARLWVIDYAGLAKSVPEDKYSHRKLKYEVISDLYVSSKELAKDADIGVLILNQFNQEGIDAARAGKTILPGHVEGGQIIERHADYDVAMTMTDEQEAANTRMLSTVKKRSAKGFRNILYSADCAVSIFRQVKQSAMN